VRPQRDINAIGGSAEDYREGRQPWPRSPSVRSPQNLWMDLSVAQILATVADSDSSGDLGWVARDLARSASRPIRMSSGSIRFASKQFEFNSLRQRAFSFRDSPFNCGKNAHLAVISHPRSTGELRWSGSKCEFWKFLSVPTLAQQVNTKKSYCEAGENAFGFDRPCATRVACSSNGDRATVIIVARASA
jgi:hypothetical protein